MELKNKTIIVTGGGNGLGRELVLNLLKRGNKVIAFDINEAALQETRQLARDKKDSLATKIVDITNFETLHEKVNEVIGIFGQVDGIINNAGIIQPFKKLNDLSYLEQKRVIDINLGGTVVMIKAYLPHLLARPEAHIINISSMGGFLPVPGQSIYGAAKSAVKIISECLSYELSDTNVRVTVVSPGAIFTNIKSNSGLENEASGNASDYKVAPKGVLLPSVAAEIILNEVQKNKVRVFVGKDSKIMNLLYHISPAFACKLIYNKVKDRI